ncbi:MAG: precorrin-2 C(20)-methyltransferase [Synergistaceae bacterium]|nr:precorrin-2 C(20)-methyltransferase [Synergistaceae bacterium]
MKLIAAGVGPGDPELVTIKALNAIHRADLIVIPHSGRGRSSVAESILGEHIHGKQTLRIVFPMTRDSKTRDEIIYDQLNESRGKWSGVKDAVMPILGDAALYSTAAYLFGVLRRFVPTVELEIIPGVSAHSLASASAGKFLAMDDEILAIVPGTAGRERVVGMLVNCDVAAIFKPSALKDDLRDIVSLSGPWERIIRVNRAGLPGERLSEGDSALEDADEYLSTLLLWRNDHAIL